MNPQRVSDYKLISLCNVVYKLISKVIANRLKPILPSIILVSQSAFIQDRLIIDNVIIGYEAIHSMRARQKSKGSVAIKLDISRAYDRVKWVFLQRIMEKLKFEARLITQIMQCISTVSYSVLVNGLPGTPFQPTRGIGQGNPLSPYLYLL